MARGAAGRAATGFGIGLLALLVGAAGCGGRKVVSRDESNPRVLRLTEIYEMAFMTMKGNQPRPKSLQDFKMMQRGYPHGVKALVSGECVFVWSTYQNPPADKAKAVLAYEKKAPKEGGYAVTLDGTVKTWTADELKATLPAR
jgi:hypothetical protein